MHMLPSSRLLIILIIAFPHAHWSFYLFTAFRFEQRFTRVIVLMRITRIMRRRKAKNKNSGTARNWTQDSSVQMPRLYHYTIKATHWAAVTALSAVIAAAAEHAEHTKSVITTIFIWFCCCCWKSQSIFIHRTTFLTFKICCAML